MGFQSPESCLRQKKRGEKGRYVPYGKGKKEKSPMASGIGRRKRKTNNED